MNPKILLLMLIFVSASACNRFSKEVFDPRAEEILIRGVLDAQQIAWNNGDIEAFMEGYWKSDSLEFISPRGINKGWNETLQGYKEGYPDRAAMGTLSFEILKVTPLSPKNFTVTGRYHVTRSGGNLNGMFTLIHKKIDGRWVAVYDHTCGGQ